MSYPGNGNGNGNGKSGLPVVLTKTSAVQISLYSLLFVLAQAVIMTATIMTMRQSDQAVVTKLESDLNWVRANQAAYSQLPEKIGAGERATDLLRQRVDYLAAELNGQGSRQNDLSRSSAKIGEDTLKNSVMIQNILNAINPHSQLRQTPNTP